ncbi:MAG TPA: hypothetical protein VKT75_11425 [Acidobacteriaceae bacterium]|nr:hypothetical protein [Acidobacteriaceae bacterium]
MKRSLYAVLAAFAIAALSIACAGAQSSFSVTDLGQATVSGINAAGQVCGSRAGHAFLWTNGVFQDLGVPKGYTASYGTAVNNSGHVAGYAVKSSTYHAFLWRNGAATDLGILKNGPSSNSWAYGINDSDEVVGACGSAFLWTAATGMVNLGTLGGKSGYAYGINTGGDVVGMAQTPAGQGHPFAWTPARPNGTSGTMQDLGALPGGDGHGWGRAVNDSQQIVGFSYAVPNALGTPAHAFLWQNATMTDLGILPGGFNSDAYAVNGGGAVVGQADVIDPSGTSATWHAALWQPGQTTPTDLNTLIPSGLGVFLSGAVGINSSGWIAAYSGTYNGSDHAYLLRPQ